MALPPIKSPMKYLSILLLCLSCAQLRSPAQYAGFQEVSFKTRKLDKDILKNTYPHLPASAFEEKFENSLERPLLFFRSYVNTYYAETLIRGPLKEAAFCYGDPHPENFGFVSFAQVSEYVFNDLDDSGYCPIGLDILRYFSALRLTISDENMIKRLTDVFVQTVQGKEIEEFIFEKPDLRDENIKNLKKYTANDQILEKKNVVLIKKSEKQRVIKELTAQLPKFKILDIALYQKNDGGSAGLTRYWVLIEHQSQRELIELKQLTFPAVGWSGLDQDFDRRQTPNYIWGDSPDYYGHVQLGNELFMTRTKADDYIDLNKLTPPERFMLLSYQVQLLARFHRDNLNRLGGIEPNWILNGSQSIAQRYQETFSRYKR